MSEQLLDGYIEPRELAKQIKTSKRTLDRWDKKRIGPPRIVIGRKIYYRREAVLAWLNSREVDRREPRIVRRRNVRQRAKTRTN
jgi:predicted DNA-binding transcriptional regulator AlpA